MPGLVGEYRVHIIAYRGLINGVVFAQILRQKHPVCGMILLVPGLEVAQEFLVVTLQRTALDVEEAGHGGTGDGEVIQDRLLKKPRILRTDGFLLRPGGIRRE